MKIRKNQLYTGRFNFSLGDVATLGIGEAGVSLGVPATDRNDFTKYVRENFVKPEDIVTPDNGGLLIPEGLEFNIENFVGAPFRLLSSTIVGAGSWKAAEFKPSVLRKAVNMLIGKGVFTRHNMNPRNWAGYVGKTWWQGKSVTADGVEVPAGINGVLMIDTTRPDNLSLAQGIIAGAVYSNSVSIEYTWKPSHDFDNVRDFIWSIGEVHEDGEMIRRIAVDVVNMHETSLVDLGADPYAKKLDSKGKIINPDVGGIMTQTTSNSLKAEFNKANSEKKFYISCGLTKNILSLTGKAYNAPNSTQAQKTNNKPPQKSDTMNPELKAALLSLFGVKSLDEVDVAELAKCKLLTGTDAATFDKLNGAALAVAKESNPLVGSVDMSAFCNTHVFVSADKLKDLKAAGEKVKGLEAKVTELEAAAAKENEFAKLGKEFQEKRVELAKKAYRLAYGDKTEEAVLGIFDKATGKELDALIKQHGLKIGSEFSYTCGECGSGKFEFRSSAAGNNAGDAGNTSTATEKLEFTSTDDIYKKYDKINKNKYDKGGN